METTTQNLPLLPLTSGVVLPGMVFTMALESDEAKAAAEAAGAADGRFVLVPFIDGRYASVGVVAEVMETGELPGGMGAVAVRGVDPGVPVTVTSRTTARSSALLTGLTMWASMTPPVLVSRSLRRTPADMAITGVCRPEPSRARMAATAS